jgi:hypothetical protein
MVATAQRLISVSVPPIGKDPIAVSLSVNKPVTMVVSVSPLTPASVLHNTQDMTALILCVLKATSNPIPQSIRTISTAQT